MYKLSFVCGCVCALKETVDDQNLVSCDNCNRKQQAVKQLHMHKLSPILVIHLKRFQYESLPATKIDTDISIPLQMQLPAFLAPALDGRLPSYSLYAVSNHYGTDGEGHYTATCNIRRDLDASGWTMFNDSTSSHNSTISGRSAYVLFYRRTK